MRKKQKFTQDDYYNQFCIAAEALNKLEEMIAQIPRHLRSDFLMELNTFAVGPGSIREFEREISAVSMGLCKFKQYIIKTNDQT